MKLKHLKNSSNNYFRSIKNEAKQIKIYILNYALWLKNIQFTVLQKKNLHVNKFFSFKYVSNYCLDSGRSKSLQSFFWVSRICLRELSGSKLFCGLKKSSW